MGGRVFIRTFGCQMSQHDTEKLTNLLLHEGYAPVPDPAQASLVLVQTCSVREKAEQKLYSELGQLEIRRRDEPGLLVGVGGCVAQQEGGALLRRFPGVDFVFGPQNLRHLPTMLAAARQRGRSLRVDYADDPRARFDLPERHPEFESPTPGRAFVTVMEGCDLFCAFCTVPRTRGREVSRPSQDIVGEVRAHADRGAVEITLLGQTVNAYGRLRPGRGPGEVSFAELLRRVAAVPGIERVRFTSPHPIFTDDDLVACYGELPELCPHLHLPVQSGSSTLLRAMNRRYDRQDYLALIDRLRGARPDLALTTDLIVGFPGETDADFEETLSLVQEVGFDDSFSFKYSPRPGTPAERRGLPVVDPALAQERLAALQAVQKRLTLRAHRRRLGSRTRVLVERASRRGGGQQAGRCPYNRVVNFQTSTPTEAGTFVDLWIVEATPHSLIGAEGPIDGAGDRAANPVELHVLSSSDGVPGAAEDARSRSG